MQMRHPSTHRRAAAAFVAGLVAIAPSAVDGAECWLPPVAAPVADPFRPPPCRWCAGNRGIEYASSPGTEVRSVRAGVVTFAGPVAGTSYVVVEHPDGLRATYGRLALVGVARGDVVVGRSVLGTTTRTFHFGLRDGRRYLDPTPRFGHHEYPVRLVPHDGARPAPPGPPRVRCGS